MHYMGNGRKCGRLRSILGENTLVSPISSKYFENYGVQVEHKQTGQTHRQTDWQTDNFRLIQKVILNLSV